MTFRSEPLLQITNIRKDGVTSIIKGRNAVYIQKKISYILKNSCFLDEEKTEKIFLTKMGVLLLDKTTVHLCSLYTKKKTKKKIMNSLIAWTER